eukprot:GHUV01018735.1.p1 GENE.GHUV01018735.1~~GHUV01018735.1.p1  ORF type:complete len:255 (+),score=72.84 GHUV01018735.1:456-1220(+)
MARRIEIASAEELPVINISALYSQDSTSKAQVAQQIHSACVQTGFFYVCGHQVDQQWLFDCIRQLFALPLDDKLKLDAKLSSLRRGYTGLGGAHNCVPEESCTVGPDNKESFLLGAEGSRSPMLGPNTWPDPALLPGWREHIQTYFNSMLDLSRVVARGLALSLGLPEQFFNDKMQDPVAQLLLLRYPPPPPPPAETTASQDTAASQQNQHDSSCPGASEQQQQSSTVPSLPGTTSCRSWVLCGTMQLQLDCDG